VIKKISFKNYKLFKKEQSIEIKPITVLIGKNNTGKSAVLKLPTLLENSLSGKLTTPFELVNNGVKLGDFPKDLVYGKGNREVEFKIFNEVSDFLKVGLRMYDDVPKIDFWNFNDEIKLSLEEEFYKDQNDQEWKTSFEGFFLSFLHNNDDNLSSGEIPILDFSLKTDYISSVRQEGLSNYIFKNITNIEDKSGIKGENLYQFLIEDSQTIDKKYFNDISNWYKTNFEGWEIKIEMDSGRNDKPVLIFLEKENLKINLSDTGTGIIQSLPLVIRSFKPCNKETLIIIEEPESHLHPYAHAQLAQCFVDSLKKDPNKKYLIETHSQNFVLRLRRLVAEGFLNCNDISLNYIDFDQKNNESFVNQININKKGGVDFWPEGIFGETTIETRAIYNAQLNDLNDVD
jgi:AAA15 family ATPase/GTPase